MKNRNRIIICLLVFGAALFIVVQFFIIPHNNLKEKNYLLAQQSPATHDLNTILEYKNKYMGNSSNDINLFNHLPLSNVGMNFRLYPDDLKLEVNYKDTVWNIGEEKVKSSLIYNSTAAFALIDNLQVIVYNFSGASYQVKRSDIEKIYPNLSNILTKGNWQTLVQSKMNDKKFVENTFQKIFDKN